MTYTLFFIPVQIISFIKFCGGPLVVEALGNCPVCPPPALNPAPQHVVQTSLLLSAVTPLVVLVVGLLLKLGRPALHLLLLSLFDGAATLLPASASVVVQLALFVDARHREHPELAVVQQLHPADIPATAVRYDTRCYLNVRSKADISQLNLPHGTDN